MAVLMMMQASFAEDASDTLHIQIKEKVIYCSAELSVKNSVFKLPMQDGIAVATEWHVKIGKVRQYWLNESIGNITVMRRVEPDLLTHSWLLVDVSSGISQRVYSIDDAIVFLSVLKHFPVLDRSLLLTNVPYRAAVNVNIHVGAINPAWWASLWPTTAASMRKDFTLP
ncbi:DUF4390 domain-containing protein [Mariprofundus sp. EBB-1]|uniref:DUF4390 domain-containing protein n=1 Tax=Mariprofundus sp. EBB-1 TaxID=2650971 RepID=UPI000EF1CE33|nr:DUF4390 domain-containing protein [Mariprofundus sp. EBB-1]RLL55676.1 DUF4390 domain-containing protein [Mariprofundus sp. EBB-1]